jgi:pyruvate/2-oxoglutarate dehydrogenase complex dihydrolipoamide acyltransferase (E2) component
VAADADTDAAGAGAAPGDEAEASAPPAIASAVNIPAPPAGKGQVVFFREKKFAGSAVRFKVRENDEELGKLGSGVYFIHVTDPGVHEYVVHSEAKDALTLEVEDGETYYVSGSITMGLLVGRPNLSPADEGAFAAAADKLSPAKE